MKLLYDSHHLYIGVMCYDSEPERIIGTQMARDADLSADDRIEILIDTFRDRRNAFYFSKRRWKIDGTWWFGTYWSGHADQIETSCQVQYTFRF